jgi:hypothetical protein
MRDQREGSGEEREVCVKMKKILFRKKYILLSVSLRTP